MAVDIISFDRAALLLKDEASNYGTDPTPDGSNDSMLISNGRVRFQANKLVREIDQAFLGARPFILTGRQAFIEFDFEVMGSATEGDSAPIAPIMTACGHAETLVASTSAAYNPVSSGFDSGAAYFYIPSGNSNGATKHVILGMRGSITTTMQVNGFVKGRAVLQGTEAVLSNEAFPSQTLSAFQDPIAVTPSTWAVSVDDGGGAHLVDCVEVQIDQGNRVQFYETSEQQQVAIVGRDSTGYLRIMSPAQSDFDPYALAVAGTKVDIQSTVTGGTGKNVNLAIATAQLELPEPIEIDGAAGFRIPFSALPSGSGNNEYVITF